MSNKEKEWLKEMLKALREGKDMTSFRHSSFLSSIVLELHKENNGS